MLEHYAIDTVLVLVAVLQVIIGAAIVPVGKWMFSANASIRELYTLIKELRDRIDTNGGGIPTRCALHGEALTRLERKMDGLCALRGKTPRTIMEQGQDG